MSVGYTQREASFLVMAALHSGYFVRRQFLMHSGKNSGQMDENFLRKAMAKKHVRPTTYRADRVLYHLGSKPLYELIGETDNRNRRQHQVFTIKCRVMALDYVLQHRDCRFLATEREKIDFFCGKFRTDRAHLPTRQYRAASGSSTTHRVFVDKFPISVRDGAAGVNFSYIDEGLHSTSGFEGYLLQYEALFREIPECRIVYVAVFPDQFSKATRVFERFVASRNGPPPLDPRVGRLLRYFRARNAYDLRDLKDFTQAKLIQFREDRNEFGAVEYERMFEDWKRAGDDVVLSRFGAQKASATHSLNVAFCTHLLPFNYQLFGTLGNGNWQGRAVS
jgi:hypothetical protein